MRRRRRPLPPRSLPYGIQRRVERPAERPDPAEQLHVLERLNAAEAFENFLQTKYVGQKRFSLEGGESAIPILDEILQGAAEDGLDEVVIAMPHRPGWQAACTSPARSTDRRRPHRAIATAGRAHAAQARAPAGVC